MASLPLPALNQQVRIFAAPDASAMVGRAPLPPARLTALEWSIVAMDLRPGVETLSMDGKSTVPRLPGITDEDARHVYYYAILPNFLLNLHPDFMMLAYAGLIAATVGLFWITPTGFIPAQDQGYFLTVIQLPPGSSLERTDAVMEWHRNDECSQRLAQIPGVGPIGASMLMMKTPDPHQFKCGRDFAAWMGLTPKDHSTAGKTRLGGITRAGDELLRSTLVVGATAVIQHVQRSRRSNASPWLLKLLERKTPKLAAVALANKIAPIA